MRRGRAQIAASTEARKRRPETHMEMLRIYEYSASRPGAALTPSASSSTPKTRPDGNNWKITARERRAERTARFRSDPLSRLYCTLLQEIEDRLPGM